MLQSNRSIPAIAASSGAKSSGSAKDTSGSTTGIAPRADRSRASASLCAAERVMAIRFPAKALGDASATLAAHFFQGGLCARFDEHSRHVCSRWRLLVRRVGAALLHLFHSPPCTNPHTHHQLAPLAP